MFLDLKDFYTGKRILVTGHNGFKGTWLTLMLNSLGAKVFGYALLPEKDGFYSLAMPEVEEEIIGDIRDKSRVEGALECFQPEIIIHLASHSTIDKEMILTDYIFETNVIGVVNLLEAVRKTECVRSVVIVTSDKVYKNKELDEPYSESAVLGAQDPYSTSKACQELVVECYRDTFFEKEGRQVNIATARASNVIGGGDYNMSRLFPSMLNDFIAGKCIQIRNPYAIRPWQNVLDVLGGYLLLCKKLYDVHEFHSVYADAFNFGPNEDGFITVKKAADKVACLFDNATYQIQEGNNPVKETKILKLDSSKAKEKLGWKPCYTIDETIEMTVGFAKRQNAGEDVGEITRSYIERFFRENVCR